MSAFLPRTCPACGGRLFHTRLACEACDVEVNGSFAPCEYCALSREDRVLLRLFLLSKGNLKVLQRHLGVSYTTARVRYEEFLSRLDLHDDEGEDDGDGGRTAEHDAELSVLEALATGVIDVAEARQRLANERTTTTPKG